MSSSRIYNGWSNLDDLAESWDRILRSCADGIRGPDATCSTTWARTLAQTHLRDADVRILAIESGDETIALLPTFVPPPSGVFPFRKRALQAITQAYSGRCGLLATNNDVELTKLLLERLVTEFTAWDQFVFSLVEGSSSHAAVMAAAQALSLRSQSLATSQSPYIELGPTAESVISKLPKKMRWTIRKSEKDLRSKGTLDYESVTESRSVQSLIESIYSVERNSWKEESGTSVTSHGLQQRFYEALIANAAEAGILSAHVLRIDSEPIAYVLGLLAGDGVFLDLKESFVAAHADYSPGHVLKRFVLETLIARGTHTYDFMGGCEPYKMRWTDKTYRSVTLSLFNRTLNGNVQFWRSRATSALSRQNQSRVT